MNAGEPQHFPYTATFGNQRIAAEPLARAMATRLGDGSPVGRGNQPGAVRIIIDFPDHAALARDRRRAIRQEHLRVLREQCLREGTGSLSTAERTLLAADRSSLTWLHQQIWLAPADSVWGQLLQKS